MIKQNLLISFFFIIFMKINIILTLNVKLNNVEENLLYFYLKNETNLNFFYEKLIHSNGIENLKDIRHKITNEDIEKENFQNKVYILKNLITFYFSSLFLIVFSINK